MGAFVRLADALSEWTGKLASLLMIPLVLDGIDVITAARIILYGLVNWIVLCGLLMASIALVGAVTLLLPERTFQALVLPLVALSAGCLVGGALFHLLPEAVHAMDEAVVSSSLCNRSD